MKIKTIIITLFIGILLSLPFFAQAQVTQNYWKVLSNILQPVLSTWQLKIPQLGGSGTRCVQVDNTGLFSVAASACGTGGGGGSELNWSFFNNSGIRLGTTSNQVLISGTGTGVSTTTSSKLEVGYESTAKGSLLALGSTTLQNFTFLNATGSKATTTSLFSTLGNFNTLCIALDCKTAWPTSGTGASTTLLADNNTFTGNNTFGKATSSSFAITSILSKLLKTDASGNVIGATAGSDYENPLTFSTGVTRSVNAITCDTASSSVFGCLASADWTKFNNKVSSSSQSATFPLGYNSTTGVFTFNGLGTTTSWSAGQLAYIVNGNTLTGVATTSASCSGNTTCSPFTVIGASPITISSTGGGTGLSTSSPISGSNVLVYSSTGAGSAYGVATSGLAVTPPLTFSGTLGSQIGGVGGSFGLDLTANYSWTGTHSFAQPTSFNGLSNNGTATTTNLTVTGSSTIQNLVVQNSTTTKATTTSFAISSVPSALLKTDANGSVTGYTGTSCTNQFPRSLSALGVATCASVANTDLTNSSFNVSYNGLSGDASVALGGTLNLTAKVSTSSVPTVGGLAYWTSNATPSLLGTVATTTLTATAPLSLSQPISVIGSSPSALTCTTATGSVTGCLSSTDWTTFNNKISSSSLSGASVISYTSGTGVITTAGGTFGAGDYVFPSNLTVLGSTTLQNFTALNSTTSKATTTNFFATIASTSQLFLSTGTGCLQSTNGLVSSTGSACGSGSGSGGNSKFATSTSAFLSLNPNGGNNVGLGIGTSTPAWALTVSSSTRPQFALTDSSLTSNIWTMRSMGNTFALATASPTTFATNTLPVLSIDANASSTWQNGMNILKGCYAVNGTCIGSASGALATTSLAGTATTTISGFTSDDVLNVVIYIATTTQVSVARITFNSDNGANYSAYTASPLSLWGASSNQTSLTSALRTRGGGTYITLFNINNVASSYKMGSFKSMSVNPDDSAPGIPDAQYDGNFRWSNTSSKITSITVATDDSTKTFGTGSYIMVYGVAGSGGSSSGSGTPSGSTQQLQFNDGGVFGGSTGLVWDKTNLVLSLGSSSPVVPYFGYGDLSISNNTTGLSGAGVNFTLTSNNGQTDVNGMMQVSSSTTYRGFEIGSFSKHDLRFFANNLGRMVISADGYIGIGTTTPQYASLTIASSTSSQLMLSDANPLTNKWNLRNAGGYLYFATSSPATGATSTVPSFVISPNGAVGIGTTTSATSNFGLYIGDSTAGYIVLNPTATSTFTKGINILGGCFAINGNCLTGSANATTTTDVPIDCNMPQVGSEDFAPGGAYWYPLGAVGAWDFSDATSSSVYCIAHLPQNMNSTPNAYIWTHVTATTSGTAILNIEATTTTSGQNYKPTTYTVLNNASTTASKRLVITGGTNYPSTATSTPVTNTLQAGQDLIIRYRRYGADANDTVNNDLFIPQQFLRLDVNVN